MSRIDGTRLPHVAVLLPVFNGALYLDDQISSILRQHDVNVQLRVIDDGSTDGSWDRISRWARSDARVLASRHDRNLGLHKTLHELLCVPITEYFALADQDDVWDDDKLAVSTHALADSGASLAFSRVRVVDSSGTELSSDYHTDRGVAWYTPRNRLSCVFENPVIGHTIVGTADLAQAAQQSWPELAFHEVLLVSHALEAKGIVPIDRVLGSYRNHSTNVSGPRARSSLRRLRQRVGRRERLVARHSIRRLGLVALAGSACVTRIGYSDTQSRVERMFRAGRLFRLVRDLYPSRGGRLALRETLLNLLTPSYQASRCR